MNFFNKWIESKTKNVIEELADLTARELKQNNKKAPLFEGLELNRENLLSFIIAEICFEMKINPLFKQIKIRPEYEEFLNKKRGVQEFQLCYKSMVDYYNGKPNLDKALKNLTWQYLVTCWSAPTEMRQNPVLLMSVGLHLAMLRGSIKKYLEGWLIKQITF